MKIKLLYIGILIIILVGGFAIYSYSDFASAKCPDDYGTDEAGSAEYLAATDKWTNDFFDSHPEATLLQWAEARKQFWIDNDCKAALEGYEQAQADNADPETLEMIKDILREDIGE